MMMMMMMIIVFRQVADAQSSGNGTEQGAIDISARLGFLRIARVLRITRLLKLSVQIAATARSELQRQVLTEALALIALVFVFAGMFMVCETELVDAELMFDKWGKERLYFHEALYFVIITISTGVRACLCACGCMLVYVCVRVLF